MNYKGINYDTGTKTLSGGTTREIFDLDAVTKEIAIIKNELHCNAIRISGFQIDRVAKASEIALTLGLTVWFSPSLQYGNQENTWRYIIEGAAAAEKLRTAFPGLIFVVGCELSIFTSGFINGETGAERLKNMFGLVSMVKNLLGVKRRYNRRLNAFLLRTLIEVRKCFKGQVTYASGTWEKVNWELFDLVGVDHYRSVYNKSIYVKELENYKRLGKPLCIMEFGCCTYKGAEDKGAMGWAIVDWRKDKPTLTGQYMRDEETQAKYILELLTLFDQEKIFAGFVFTFIMGNYIYSNDARHDLDMASYGIVKVLPYHEKGYNNLPWVPKQAFFDLGSYYSKH